MTEGNWVIHTNLGLVNLNDGRIEEAIWHFNQAIKAKPSYGLAYLNLGAAYLTNGDYDKAIEAFKWSLRFDQFNPKAHNGLGIAYLRLGQRNLAQAEHQILIDLGSPLAADLLEMINSPQAGGLKP